jgi:hypothetical protein
MVTRPGDGGWLDLRELLQQAENQPGLQRYRRRRWGRSEEFAGWIGEAALASLSMERATSMYVAAGGKSRTEFESNTVEEIRESLDFLLYDTVMLEGRFQECAAEGGAYKLAGAGKELVSYLLCVRDPTLFAVWDSNVERALRKLGVPTEDLKKSPLGVGYLELLEALSPVRRRLGLADFRAVDEFAYALTRGAGQGGL